MTTRRTVVIALCAGFSLTFAAPASVAQQAGRVRRVGFLGAASATAPGSIWRVEARREGLRSLGYVEGRTVAIEFRWANDRYERLPALAADLVRSKVEVIVT